MFADEDEDGGVLVGDGSHVNHRYYIETPGANTSDLNYLTNYISALNIFACPSTRNYISWTNFNAAGARISLLKNAQIRDVVTNLNSYAPFRMYGQGGTKMSNYKTINLVSSYTHKNSNALWPIPLGTAPGAVNTMIFSDQDYSSGPSPNSPSTATDPNRVYDNYPEAGDNHGKAGNNVAYCDGHVEFVPQKKYPYMFVLSQDQNESAYDPPP